MHVVTRMKGRHGNRASTSQVAARTVYTVYRRSRQLHVSPIMMYAIIKINKTVCIIGLKRI